MLEQLLIFTRGGLILWTYQELASALRGSPIDALIRSCLLEERNASSSFQHDAPGCSYTLKWTYNNDLGLVFVAVYRKILHLLYVDELLESVKREFSPLFNPKRTDFASDFDDTFRQLLLEAEARSDELRSKSKQMNLSSDHGGKQKTGSSSRGNGKGGKNASSKQQNGSSEGENGGESEGLHRRNGFDQKNHNQSNGIGKNSDKKASINGGNGHSHGHGHSSSDEDQKVIESAFNVDKLHKLKSKGGKKGSKSNPIVTNNNVEETGVKKTVKKNRVWDDAPAKNLDHSEPLDSFSIEAQDAVLADQGLSLMDAVEDDESDLEIDEEVENTPKQKENVKKKEA